MYHLFGQTYVPINLIIGMPTAVLSTVFDSVGPYELTRNERAIQAARQYESRLKANAFRHTTAKQLGPSCVTGHSHFIELVESAIEVGIRVS